MGVKPFRSLINPDDELFANPDNMIGAIQTYCRNTSQPIPETPAEICRCIFDSLALRYKQVFQWLQEFSAIPEHADESLSVLHIIGGGSLNKYLNQFTANATGATVLAGPQECTAIGNIMLQAKASGQGFRPSEGYLADAPDHRKLHRSGEIRAPRQRSMECRF